MIKYMKIVNYMRTVINQASIITKIIFTEKVC